MPGRAFVKRTDIPGRAATANNERDLLQIRLRAKESVLCTAACSAVAGPSG